MCRFAHSTDELVATTQADAGRNALLVKNGRPVATGEAPPAKGSPY